MYSRGVVVNLSAPITVAGRTFQKWKRDGADFSTESRVQVQMDTDHALVAVYGEASFHDVGADEPFWPWIEPLFKAGVTGGCSTIPRAYCPDQIITREQLAVFLLRAKHGSSYAPPAPSGLLVDVLIDDPFAAWIEQLFTEAITSGCGTNPLRFCPGEAVTRRVMAVFLLRARHGTDYQPPPAVGMFVDVPVSDPFAPWVEELARADITSGCATGPARYCPDAPVTRGQMAVFLVRAFGLPL